MKKAQEKYDKKKELELQKQAEKKLTKKEKEKKKKRIKTIVFSGIALILVLAVLATVWYIKEGSYVGKVGKTEITKDVYTYFLNDYARTIENQQSLTSTSDITSFWAQGSSTTSKDTYETLAKTNTLERVQNFMILLEEASKTMTLNATEKKDIDTYFKNIITSLKTKAKADAKIKENYGVTYDQYKEIYTDQQLVSKYVTKFNKDLGLTDKSIKAYYEKNKINYDKVTVAHILLKTTDPTTNAALSKEKTAEIKKKADGILEDLENGSNFKKLVTKYSEDTASVSKGGEYTLTNNDSYLDQFKNWALSSKRKVGDLGMVKTEAGYHIMKFIKTFPYSELKSDIKTAIENEKLNDQLTKFKALAKYKISKNIRVFNEMKILIPTATTATVTTSPAS